MRTSNSNKSTDSANNTENIKEEKTKRVIEEVYPKNEEPFEGFNKLSKEIDEALLSDDEPFDGFRMLSGEIDEAIKEEQKREMDRLFEDDDFGIEDEYILDEDDENVLSDAVKDYKNSLLDKELEEFDEESKQLEEEKEDKDTEEEYLENENTEEVEDIPNSKKNKIINKIISTTVILFIVGVIVFVGVNFFSKDKVSVSSYDDMVSQINSLYTDDDKNDLNKDVTSSKVNKYKLELGKIEGNEESKNELALELKSISNYISDKDKIKEVLDNNYDFNNSITKKTIDGVESSAKTYSVPGLMATMLEYTNQAEQDYEYFIELRDELSTIDDFNSFNKDSYQKKVNKVTHSVNKQELQGMVDELQTAKKKQEEINSLKEKATQEALDKAEKLKKETEEALKNSREELNTYKEEAKSFFGSLLDKFTEFFNWNKKE